MSVTALAMRRSFTGFAGKLPSSLFLNFEQKCVSCSEKIFLVKSVWLFDQLALLNISLSVDTDNGSQ